MFTIKWGDAADQLKITPEELYYGEDSLNIEYHPGIGPSLGLVDDRENVMIISRQFSQLKCFDHEGHLILDKENLETGICRADPVDAYIDSSSHFYLTIDPPLNYVPVADMEGRLLERLFPYADTLAKIERMYSDISGELFFWANPDTDYVAYGPYGFRRVANSCMMAANGYLYAVHDCNDEYPFHILIVRYYSPERLSPPLSVESTYIDMAGDSIFQAVLLEGGNGSALYVLVDRLRQNYGLIYEFDLAYEKIDQILTPYPNSKYNSRIAPFVDRQGRIYEFRFMDDGLHVVKWTKEQ